MKPFSNYATTSVDENSKNYSNVMFSMPDFSAYEEDYKIYTITSKTEFRPDKIAMLIYEDDALSWVLDEINGLNRLSEYTRGKNIFYLPFSTISVLVDI